MHGLANIFTDNPSLQVTNEIQEFLEVLSSVQNGLNNSIEGLQLSTKKIINKTPPPLATRRSPPSHRAK